MSWFDMKYLYALFILFSFIAPAAAQTIQLPETEAKQAYVVDFETGTVLYDKNGEEQMPTSSMSKVLTSVVADDAVRSGKVSLDQKFAVSEKAWKMGGSRMFLDVNTEVAVGDLIKGVIIQSGNDACVALAEGIAGSEANFVVMMNEKAKEIGMDHSNFMNASGWPDPNHYSTAKDLTKLAVYLIKNYPEEYKVYSMKDFTYNNIKQGNRNPLLYRNIGADGIKTGHTDAGGYGLMGSAVAGDRRVVLVINGTSSMQARADELAKLMEWALTSFKNMTLTQKDKVVDTAPVVLSEVRQIPVVAAEDVKSTVPSFTKDGAKVTLTYQSPLKAPIAKGDVVGKIDIVLANGQTKTVDAVAGADAPEMSFFKKIMEKLMIKTVGVPE